jgi:hypothetical protein
MTFGRPTMVLGTWDVIAPSMIDDEYLTQNGDGVQPPDLPSRMGLFVYSLQLFEIMDEVLSSFYIRDSGRTSLNNRFSQSWSPEELLKVLNISSKLDRFGDSLPDFLRPEFGSITENEPQYNHLMLQAKVLHCRSSIHLLIILASPFEWF